MKSLSKLVGALVVGFVGVANAEQVIVYEAPLGMSGSEPLFIPPVERQVDGLYYDSARKQVLYRTAAGPIVCAEDATTLGETYLKDTGNCRLIRSTEQRSFDDGFDVREEPVAKVVFDAQTSTAPQHAAAPR